MYNEALLWKCISTYISTQILQYIVESSCYYGLKMITFSTDSLDRNYWPTVYSHFNDKTLAICYFKNSREAGYTVN